MQARPHILVIDDNSHARRAVQAVLERQGFDVLTAPGGEEGLTLASEAKPDLIILDIVMPKMDGYEVCRRLQQDPETAHIPVIMLSGKGRVDPKSGVRSKRELYKRIGERLAGYESGAVEFLSKPVRVHELVERVRGLL